MCLIHHACLAHFSPLHTCDIYGISKTCVIFSNCSKEEGHVNCFKQSLIFAFVVLVDSLAL